MKRGWSAKEKIVAKKGIATRTQEAQVNEVV